MCTVQSRKKKTHAYLLFRVGLVSLMETLRANVSKIEQWLVLIKFDSNFQSQLQFPKSKRWSVVIGSNYNILCEYESVSFGIHKIYILISSTGFHTHIKISKSTHYNFVVLLSTKNVGTWKQWNTTVTDSHRIFEFVSYDHRLPNRLNSYESIRWNERSIEIYAHCSLQSYFHFVHYEFELALLWRDRKTNDRIINNQAIK